MSEEWIVGAWSALANVIMAGAAVAAAIAAWVGLSTWKAQALWNADAGVAKSILILLFKHNDALKNVRHSAIWSDEIDDATKSLEFPKDHSARRFSQTSAVYSARWKGVQKVRAELYPLIIEGQALWGNDFKDQFIGIWNLENELKRVVHLYLDQLDPSHDVQTKDELAKIRRSLRDILYLNYEVDDSFIADYLRALQPIEDFLRDKLGRKQ